MPTTYTKATRTTGAYTPAYLTGSSWVDETMGGGGWRSSITDWSFDITIDGTLVEVRSMDFSWLLSFASVPWVIQTALRAETGSTETVVYDTDHFVISSVDTTINSSITVTSTAWVGTDISTKMKTHTWTVTWKVLISWLNKRATVSTSLSARASLWDYYDPLADINGNYIKDINWNQIYCFGTTVTIWWVVYNKRTPI